MIVIPAIDVLDHKVVQLVGGVPGSQQIILPDPYETAMSWVERGAPYLHLVDLDGAFGKEDNFEVFSEIIKDAGVPCEVGGGIRSEDQIRKYVDAGADRVIVGTKAVTDLKWLRDMASKFPKKLMLGLDLKGGKIAIKGWQEEADISLRHMFVEIRDMPLAAVLNTNIDVEGKTGGIDREDMTDFVIKCPKMVIVSGGVTTKSDAEIASSAGAGGVVVGLALYKGIMKPWDWELPWTVD